MFATSPHLAFDAIELISAPQADTCTGCQSLKYKVEREPPLPQPVVVSETYVDCEVSLFEEFPHVFNWVEVKRKIILK